MKYLIYIILICIILFFVKRFLSQFKFPKVGSLAVVTGAIKSGKTAFSVGLALSNYRRVHFMWKLDCFFVKFFNLFREKSNQFPCKEEPLLYSNIPLSVKCGYNKLTLNHLLRKTRFNFKSVVLIDEASLVADSQLIKNQHINTQLLLFFKLFGHETHGGLCVFNSQSITDLHYALKRCTTQYFFVHHISKYIPFVCVADVREQVYNDDNSTFNVYNEDIECSMKKVLMRKSVFKAYDYCAFSIFTDNLPKDNKKIFISNKDNKKVSELLSFRKEFQNFSFLWERENNEKT